MDPRAELPSVEFDEDGVVPDDNIQDYVDHVMERFAASPEGGEVEAAQGGLYWAAVVLDYGLRYLGVDLKRFSVPDLNEILLDIFPAKVSCSPGEAVEIVNELRAFWRFLQREFELLFTPDLLATLDDPLMIQVLETKLADPANYGMAKSFVMAGRKAGFDMTTPDGVEAFQVAWNEGLPQDTERPDEGKRLGGPARGEERKAKSRKRKAQKLSRRKNRRKR